MPSGWGVARVAEVGLDVGGLGGVDVAGDGVQHVLAGDPALQVLSVGGQHRQAVAAVEHQLAQRLGQALVGEEHLKVRWWVTGPGSQAPVLARAARRVLRGGWVVSGGRKGRMASAAVSSSKESAEGARSMSVPRRSSLVV